ncbi:MAG: TylF/MycF/NovP-related O-methyltransferase [Oceanococcus sp.]
MSNVGCIVLGTLNSQIQFTTSRDILANAATANAPLEYLAIPALENAGVEKWDKLTDVDFVSPMLSKQGMQAFEIFEASLKKFNHKTEIRDFLDLWGLLNSVIERNVAGCITEFGSFWGHSGWLIAKSLQRLGSDKMLYMFDMFENFPDEGIGIDKFWSNTHPVNFETVRAKFTDEKNVQLVKGDFTKTLAGTDTGPLALAFIDCDSFRATLHVLEEIWDKRLSVGGIVILEDYGHAALLGNRIAAHDFFDGRADAYCYFSQFSGFFVAVKLERPAASA